MPRPTLKQRADGRYCCKYKSIQFMGDSPSEAFAKRDEYKRQEAAGLKAEAKGITVRQYAAKWLMTYKAGVTARTFNGYACYVDVLTSALGDVALKDVSATDIQAIYNGFVGKSASYIRKAAQTISGVFNAALADRLVLGNPCASIKPPKGTAGTHRAITKQEREIIHAVEHPFAPAVMVMLYAGLRRGEALAIDIDRDVDINARTITVREAVRWDSNQAILSDPKTEAGSRVVPLMQPLVVLLRDRHGLLAPSASGAHMSNQAFRRAWNGYVSAAETVLNGDTKRWYGRRKGQGSEWLKAHPWRDFSIRPHDLRHSFCTMLYDAGVDLKTAQKWMGHADTTMITRIYAHLTAEKEKSAELAVRSTVDKMLSGMQNGMQGAI